MRALGPRGYELATILLAAALAVALAPGRDVSTRSGLHEDQPGRAPSAPLDRPETPLAADAPATGVRGAPVDPDQAPQEAGAAAGPTDHGRSPDSGGGRDDAR